MIDEINYFPKRDNFQKKKNLSKDWDDLKKLKNDLNPKPQKTKKPEKKSKKEQ